VPDYPPDSVREALLNALVHRDYSVHTEGMPIQLIMYDDRMEIINPGGLYGCLTVDQLGKVQPDTRNPVLVTAMETLGKAENRYSGIPRIRHAMAEANLAEPQFLNTRSSFKVVLCSKRYSAGRKAFASTQKTITESGPNDPKGLLAFCQTPRTRQEIVDFLAISSAQYAHKRYLMPLVQSGAIRMERPDSPRIPRQRYVTAE